MKPRLALSESEPKKGSNSLWDMKTPYPIPNYLGGCVGLIFSKGVRRFH